VEPPSLSATAGSSEAVLGRMVLKLAGHERRAAQHRAKRTLVPAVRGIISRVVFDSVEEDQLLW